MLSINSFLFFCLLILFSISSAVFWHSLYRLINKSKLKKRFKKGRTGEKQAKKYLKAHGFKIIAEQAYLTSNMWIDSIKHSFETKADFLVKKGKQTSIVEVKTGKTATDPTSTNTRRQLFEYMYLYKADNIYLFDAESNKLKNILFTNKNKSKIKIWIILCLNIIIGFFFLIYFLILLKSGSLIFSF